MKKSDLRNGDIVKTREGNKYIVLLNIEHFTKKRRFVN